MWPEFLDLDLYGKGDTSTVGGRSRTLPGARASWEGGLGPASFCLHCHEFMSYFCLLWLLHVCVYIYIYIYVMASFC